LRIICAEANVIEKKKKAKKSILIDDFMLLFVFDVWKKKDFVVKKVAQLKKLRHK
jgi:hypothetical protein